MGAEQIHVSKIFRRKPVHKFWGYLGDSLVHAKPQGCVHVSNCPLHKI